MQLQRRQRGLTFIGLLFGLLGKGLFLAGLQQQLSIIIGLVIILIALIPERVLSEYTITQPLYQLIGKVKSKPGNCEIVSQSNIIRAPNKIVDKNKIL